MGSGILMQIIAMGAMHTLMQSQRPTPMFFHSLFAEARWFALLVLCSDEYLAIPTATALGSHNSLRWTLIGMRLPMELQMQMARVTAGDARVAAILASEFEAGCLHLMRCDLVPNT